MRQGSKYHALYQRLQQSAQTEITLTFDEVASLVGGLPPSAYKHAMWWGNRRSGSVQAQAWLDAGYHVVAVEIADRRVTWRKPSPVYHVRREGDYILWDGVLIKSLRQHMDLSQAELAAELGVRQQTISEWETGMYQPKRAMSKLLTLVAERAGFFYRTQE
jgi:DNA-binding XRE family transcriptional regulator